MSVLTYRILACVIGLLWLLPGVTSFARPGIGFQARLDELPSVVSSYKQSDYRFSAAMSPRTFATLSRMLVFEPGFVEASYDNSTLTFNTTFSKNKKMVPVTVATEEFLNYRLQRRVYDEKRDIFKRSLLEARQSGRREGLSIGVDLPKRFDQMFGEGGANLRVSGYRRITFSGRSQWTDAANSGINRQSRFPSLNMEQISRFDITGTIGTKISVKVSQDNQTDIPLANRLILRYKGDEDDILKSVEAGNTTLSLPNTRFVGYSQRIQGLFGLKAEAQLGNLTLTAIASQEKGSSEGASITPGGEDDAETIRDYNYQQGRVFDLAQPGQLHEGDSIRVIYIYKQSTLTDLTGLRYGVLAPDAKNLEWKSEYQTRLPFKKLEYGTDFELLYGQDPAKCPIAVVFKQIQSTYALGVFMQIDSYTDGSFDSTFSIGSVDQGTEDTLQFLMAARDDFDPNHPTWDLMWRNCYRIPLGSNIDDLEVKVFKGLEGQEGESSCLDYQVINNKSGDQYIKILGLDQYNNNLSQNKTPDNQVDNLPAVFRPDWGLLIFPSRRPFASDTSYVDASGNRADTLAVKVPEIYDDESETEIHAASQYYIQITTKTRSSIVRLGRANVIEGSERITLNGKVLEAGKDYSIQYDFGQVTFLNEDALDPNADVRIEFQYAPFLALQKKTLLGMRAEYEFSPDLRFGTTVLYKSDKAQDRKPRVGQETAKAMVMSVDGSVGFSTPFMTSLVDALPLVTSDAESKMRVTGEIAHSRPNPNVDNVAYIDDFESAIERLSLGIPRTNWTDASIPLPLKEENEMGGTPWVRGSMRWHNPPPILREDVYIGEVAAGQNSLTPLRLIYRPKPYQRVQDSTGECTGELQPTRSWGGIMRYFANRVDETRLKLFEMRVKGGKGKLHFDFGDISEDVNGDGAWTTEDHQPGNGTLDGDPDDPDREDIGLDLVLNELEVNECGHGYDIDTLPDPAGDNWWFEGYGLGASRNSSRPPIPASLWTNSEYKRRVDDIDDWMHYEWINGTDGNVDDAAVQGIPDDESLRGASTINTVNSYFSIEVPLNIDPSNPYLVEGSGRNGWYTYRIPVRDPGLVDTVMVGSSEPSWSGVSYIRVWFEQDSTGNEGVDSLGSIDSLWIADWGFVQSNWGDTLIRVNELDTIAEFYVASVSEDDSTFIPPPGVSSYTDKTNNVTEAQRGLSLVYTDLDSGDVALAKKSLLTTESYSGYKTLQMYVHGPEDLGTDQIKFFFRLGRDTSNYYEYQAILKPGWDEDNYVHIDFAEMTNIKDVALRNLESGETVDTTAFPYHIVGQPNINEVRFLAAGIENVGPSRVTGDVWLDELRVTDVRKDPGTAVRADISGNMADLITYSLSYEHRDPYFRGVSQATRGGSSNNLGSGEDYTSMSYSTTFNLQKFLPRSWGARLPISVGYSETEQVPLLRTNSDIVLPDSVREAEKSTSRSFKFTAREGFNRKGNDVLFGALLNRQEVSFSYNRSTQTTVNNPYVFNENYNVRGSYDMGIRTDVSLPIFFWTKPVPLLNKTAASRLRLFPDTWKWSGSFSRTLRARDDKDYKRTSSYSRTFDGDMNINYKPFSKISTSYNFQTRRDLTDPELVKFSLKNFKLGIENSYSESFRGSYDVSVFKWLSSQWQYSANYSDSYDRSSLTRNTSLKRSWSVSGSFRHQDLLGGSSRSGRGGRGGSMRGGGARTEQGGKPIYEPVLAGLRFMTGWLNPLGYQYSRTFDQSLPGLREKPGWKYRFGLNTADVFERGSTTRQPLSRESESYDLSSGFTLFGGLTTTVGYKTSISRDIIKSGGNRQETRSISWPDLTLSISRISFPPLVKEPFNWFVKVFAPRTTYSRQTQETENLETNKLLSRSTTTNQNPLVSVSFKVWRSLSLSGSYGITKTHDERFNTTDGGLQQETRTTRKNWGVTSKYSFSAPGGLSIPLFGKVKFRSLMTITMNVKFNADVSETNTGKTGWLLGSDKSSFTLTPDISYQFSDQIRGGLTARWQDTNDRRNSRNQHARELRIWVEITF